MTPDEELARDTSLSRENEQQSNDVDAVSDDAMTTTTQPPLTLGSLIRHMLGPEINELIDKFSRTAQRLRRFQAFALDLQSSLARYGDFIKTVTEEIQFTERDAHRTLVKYKWLITPSMPGPFLFRVAEIGRRKGNQRRAMNRLFVEYYTNNEFEKLVTMVESWGSNPLFQSRMKILRDCIAVMKYAKEGRYNAANVIVPTLIAQIDGVLTDFMQTKGLSKRGNHWIDANGNAVRWQQVFQTHATRNNLFDAGNHVFLNILFQQALYGQKLTHPTTFSRHKIMHGEYVRYGHFAHAIRAFLVLDFLSTLS